MDVMSMSGWHSRILTPLQCVKKKRLLTQFLTDTESGRLGKSNRNSNYVLSRLFYVIAEVTLIAYTD